LRVPDSFGAVIRVEVVIVVGDPVAFMVAAKVGRVSLYFKETIGKKGVRERSREI
jgi:hypothetical protein